MSPYLFVRMLLKLTKNKGDYKVDFERAIELRCQGKTYKEIAKELGVGHSALYRRFQKEYELGNLQDLTGYRAARPTDPRKGTAYHLRRGATLPVGESIPKRLTVKQKLKVLELMSAGRHRTMNDLLMALLMERL